MSDHTARFDEYLSALWLIEPLAGEMLRRLLGTINPAALAALPPPPKSEMAEARNGKTVAVIPVVGLLMKGRSLYGGSSTIRVAKDVRQAAADPGVSAILLMVDSPGGTVSGLEDLASEVRAAGKAKPVWTQAQDLLASAAYWVASQTQKIFANVPTAMVGSIGVRFSVLDQSAAAAMQGVKVLQFVTGPLKGAGEAGTQITPEQSDYFQSIVDGVQVEFDKAVKGGRGFTQAQLEAVRTGGIFKAPEAQALGLIDGIQSQEKTIDQLARAAAGQPDPTPRRRAGVLPTLPLTGLPKLKRGELS